MNVNETENCKNKLGKFLKTDPINREQSLLCTTAQVSLECYMLMIAAEQEVLKGNLLLVREELL